ncbi:uncharacterized protein [Primulina eburnea]|uniref:uncharacterized protein n=1 Tax=Primulina eburnea TaxID=1245227 RepID=UPI003C6BF692
MTSKTTFQRLLGAAMCMEVSVEEYDDVVVSSFKVSTQRSDLDANEMGVYASSRGEVDLAGNGGLSNLVENDTDNLKDHENVEENHGALSRITDFISKQKGVFDIPAPDGDCADVINPSIDDGSKTPVNKGSSDETRRACRKDENVKPWYRCNCVKNQNSVDRLSSINSTDAWLFKRDGFIEGSRF